jgi:predicted nucleotidyltransferase
MDKEQAIVKVSEFIEAIKSKYHPQKVVLFGSYAKGTYTQNSDIDVAVIVDEIHGDFLEETQGLYKIRRKIDLSIEPVLLEINSDNSRFLEEILSTGEVLYTLS